MSARILAVAALVAANVSVAAQAAEADTTPAAPQPGVEAPPPADAGLLRRRRQQGDAPPPNISVPPSAPELTTEHVPLTPRKMDPSAAQTTFARGEFRSDPTYADNAYDPAAQYEIYGGKHAMSIPRPLLELGYPLYSAGAFGPGHGWLGDKNLTRPQFLAYGDLRLAYGDNQDMLKGTDKQIERSLFVARLNLDLDLKLTGTERFHVLLRPLEDDGMFSRIQYKGAMTDDGKEKEFESSADPITAYFEGDLGQIWQGISGDYNHHDIPVAAGLVPLLFQNGVWLDDAFDGLALTLPARNSPTLGISNYDITVFAGFDEVTSAALKTDGKFEQHNGKVYGVASFFERKTWYYEFDYGYLQDDNKLAAFDRSYHNISAAATHRFGAWLSHSTRVVYNVGQDEGPNGFHTADGVAVILENSFMTRRPYTLLPYLNLFYGDKQPQSLARDPGAGGLLKNVGLNFETDNLTGFPKLDDTAANAYGGALGLEYLFALNRQIVFEVAGLDRHSESKAAGAEYAAGLRFQQPFARQWIFRVDGIIGDREEGRDLWGVRAELRCKF